MLQSKDCKVTKMFRDSENISSTAGCYMYYMYIHLYFLTFYFLLMLSYAELYLAMVVLSRNFKEVSMQ